MSVWYCHSGILVHVLCNAEKEFGEYGGLVHMADVKDQWISIEQVAKYLGVSSVTVRFWIRSGRGIPAVRIGRQWRFKKASIDEWISSGKSSFT